MGSARFAAGRHWPWSLARYALALRASVGYAFKVVGAKAILSDIILVANDVYRQIDPDDKAGRLSLRRAGTVSSPTGGHS